MFYSQFILAKKGPLGTIWIAAHLERKLRKNQVADTDIGVSVDSILSPDIPIALRLSSHLLLGVVRIYSRKVNYLFHDCSETLLKVKQAFRSTVVDLPPEESTAPYHSITLPETFDLEDFVLPDSLNSNFVDHHVSTREQITLQDSTDGTGHSTLQFGPDERFGDGDAPQIALDLDEEMFLDKGLNDHNASTPLALEEKMDIQMSGIPETPFTGMDVDDCQEVGTPSDMPLLPDPNVDTVFSDLHGYNIQTPNLNDVIFPSEDVGAPSAVPNDMEVSYPQNGGRHRDPLDHAEAPSTPGLAEEANPSRVHETPAFSPQGKTSPSNIVDDFVSETEKGFQDTCQNGSNPPLFRSCGELSGRASVHGEVGQNICEVSGQACHNNATHKIDAAMHILSQEVQVDNRMSELNERLEMDKTDMLDPQYQNIEKEVNGYLSGQKITLGSDSSLKPCTSLSNHVDITPPGNEKLGENVLQPAKVEILSGYGVRNAEDLLLQRQGDGLDSVVDQEMHHISSCLPCKNQEDCSKQDELPKIVSSNTQLGVLNYSASSGYPEPEKMLLAPKGDHGVENDLVLGTSGKDTREPDGRVDGNECLSDKKRCMVEKTPDLKSYSSVKGFDELQLKRKIDHIPNDDDLLASILVGRGASTLKMKSTPSLPSVPFSKRSRLTQKISAPKRKVLLDDTMVLQADVMRQQLTSTEDIRRTRRKAPCTRSDIGMIQKAFSEDETFGESVLTGMSAELSSLYYRTYELNEIEGCRDDANPSFSDASKTGLTSRSKITERVSDGVQMIPIQLISEKAVCQTQPSNSPAQIVVECCETNEKSHEHVHLSSELLNDKTKLLPHQNSFEEVVHQTQTSNPPAQIVAEHCETDEKSHEHVHLGSELLNDKTKLLPQQNSFEEVVHQTQTSNPPAQIVAEHCETDEKSHEHVHLSSELNNKTKLLPHQNSFEEVVHHPEKDERTVLVSDDYVTKEVPTITESRNIDIINEPSLISQDHIVQLHNVNDEAISSVDICIDFGNEKLTEPTAVGDANVCIHDFPEETNNSVDPSAITNDQSAAETGEGQLEVSLSNQIGPSSCLPESSDMKTIMPPSEITCMQDPCLQNNLNVDAQDVPGHPATKDCDGYGGVTGGDVADFLVDDEAELDEVDYDEPNPEVQSLENFGWSVRTRGVARYLRLLFDNDSGFGRKTIEMDRLLSGKTRKEASRMFFETLVLKTRDYVDVEQGISFENINIRPTAKLMKSEF